LIFIHVVIALLVSVVFITMLERKIMSYIQLRKGPNKIGLGGLITPVVDSLKLLIKKGYFPYKSNSFFFSFSPILCVLILLLVWFIFPFSENTNISQFSLLVVICVMSLGVYSNFFSGWGSNSKYSLLGSLRGVAQMVSIEVSFIFILLIIFFFNSNFSLSYFYWNNFPLFLVFPCITFIWIILTVAETNRAPFDFTEGESELVSGYNTEYGGLGFALLFLGEYGMILFFGFFTTLIWGLIIFS
uniref:NADH dehydrogenase subunit 1 n=1 Tax=Miroplana shenzhensis TaxID=2597322 RepID=UPI001FB0120B